MGTVSSVRVNPGGIDDDTSIDQGNEGTVEVFQEIPDVRTVDIRLHHVLNDDNRDGRQKEMGLTIQYLAEENAKLTLANRELSKKLKTSSNWTNDFPGTVSADHIYGETTEQKLRRLEKTLESERREKWKAIEDGEKARVDLVNCERELRMKGEDVERMKKELAEKCSATSTMEEENNEERMARRQREMNTFMADLTAKREIRQKALSAISQEMQKLRDELEKERRLRYNHQQPKDEAESKGFEMEELRRENEALRTSVRDSDELKSLVEVLKNELREEKKKREEIRREMKAVAAEKAERERLLQKMEEERERMWRDYDQEKAEVTKRTAALKDVVQISREMLVIRENQVQDLKKKLKEIEEAMQNSRLPDQSTLREEYEKQLNNIKTLKDLYEERVRLMETERDKLNAAVAWHAKTIEDQKGEIQSLREECGTVSQELKDEKYENQSLERDLRLTSAKCRDLENELSLINNLFTRMLLGPYNSGSETDLDKLMELLQENHDVIVDLTLRESSSEIASALPKLLLNLITEVDGPGQEQDQSELDTVSEQSDGTVADGAVLPILSYKKAVIFRDPSDQERPAEEARADPAFKPFENMNPAVREIASNLPKVWRVLTELLSHHTVPDGPPPGDENQCYKKVETPSGTRSVISVSNTFIRLKDLILEKNALQKELTRLKQLNSHLESRLDDQEKRLSHVQSELHKTWGIVGRMKAQHQQLHNHEKILRYELQEKRVMLSELKQELEYCRDKWERARQKNNESESQWQKLRREFAARKSKGHAILDLNDSGESGFSDEPNESGEDMENFDADRSNTQSPVDVKDNSDQSREASSEPDGGPHPEEDYQELSPQPSVSSSLDDEKLRLREERLRRLEDQCRSLANKVNITASKSQYLNNRLEELHEQYGPEGELSKTKTDREPRASASADSHIAQPSREDNISPFNRPEATTSGSLAFGATDESTSTENKNAAAAEAEYSEADSTISELNLETTKKSE